MGLGNKKGHVYGSKVSGGHSTLIDGADDVIKKMDTMPWFETVRPAEISVARGGKTSVTIRRHADAIHKDTLKLIFRKSSTVQNVYVHVRDLEANLPTIIGDITRIIGRELRGADIYDRTTERISEGVRQEVERATGGAALLPSHGVPDATA